jgi:hypothetical protein
MISVNQAIARTIPTILVLATLAPAQWLVNTASKDDWEEINFEFDSSVLVDGFPSLLRLAELLNKNPEYKVRLEGHADRIGTNQYNDKLAQRRGEMVKAFLEKYGARPTQIEVLSKGKRDPKVSGATKEGRFINRRVSMTVLDGQGKIIGAGGIGDIIKTLEACCHDYTQTLNDILKKLDKLDDIARMLGQLQDENKNLRADLDKLKGQQQQQQAAVESIPKPATQEQVQKAVAGEIQKAEERAHAANPRFTILGANAGVDQDRHMTMQGRARYFAPFGDKYAVQAQGEYFYFKDRQEGQFDLGLVDRFTKRGQFGLFSSFKHVEIPGMDNGATLGQAAGTLDYIFNRGKIGFFGTKGFLDNRVINRLALSTNVFEEKYLRIVDQAGAATALTLGNNTMLEGNIGWLSMQGGGDKPGGTLRIVQPLNSHIALTIEGGWNETLVASGKTMGRITAGLQFGSFIQPKDYLELDHAVPVDVPRIRYEMLTRRVRTGNSPPVANAGGDQIGVPAGVITLDGSTSYDPDGDPITFQWDQVAGPSVSLNNQNSSKATFTASAGQTYGFRLTVKDSLGATALARATITTRELAQVVVTKFTATPPTINLGQSTTLAWQVQNADTVTITDLGNVNPQAGTATVSPTDTKVYTLTATNKAGTVNETVQVVVNKPTVQIASFRAVPNTIKVGESANLVWETTNATTVSIAGIGNVNPSGTLSVSPTQTTTYTMTATNSTGNVTATATITVTPAVLAPTVSLFTATPTTIGEGETATLTWQVNGATSVEITGLGTVSGSGSAPVNPTTTTTYTLTAKNAGGTTTASVAITVQPTARILSFTASPSQSPSAGSPVRLSWQTSGATEVSISGIGAVSPSGSADVTPQTDTTYTLTARGEKNTATQAITVKVTGNRPPTVVLNVPEYYQTTILNHTFDASASTDPDGGQLTFKWEYIGKVDVRPVVISNPTGARTDVTLSQLTGEYIFQLTVTSSKGVSVSKLIRIILRDANKL